MYESLQKEFYKEMRAQYEDLDFYLDLILGLGVGFAFLIAFMVGIVYKNFENYEEELLTKLSTINNKMLLLEIERLHGLCIILKGNTLALDPEYMGRIHKEKSKNRRRVTTFKKIKFVRLSKATYLLLITVLGAASGIYFIPMNTILQKGISNTLSFLGQNEIVAHAYVSLVTISVISQKLQLNIVENQNFDEDYLVGAQTEIESAAINKKKFLEILTNYKSDVISNELATKELKERYENFRDFRMCIPDIGAVYVAKCLTLLDAIASNGLIVFYNRVIDLMDEIRAEVIANPTPETVALLLSNPKDTDMQGAWYILTKIFEKHLDLYIDQMVYVSQVSKEELTHLLAGGIVYFVLIFVVLWLPLVLRLQSKYMNSKQIFRILPLSILANNAYIKAYFSKSK